MFKNAKIRSSAVAAVADRGGAVIEYLRDDDDLTQTAVDDRGYKAAALP
jgi:hypothetical protein